MKTEKTTDYTTIRPFAAQFGKGFTAGPYDAETERSSYSEYGAGAVFENDASDEAKYLATILRTESLEPEKHLMLAILEDAVCCFRDNLHVRTAKKRLQFEEAEAWILEENDDALFSFESTCNILGIEPSYLRRGLMAWKKQKAQVRVAAPARAA